jgi:hypothetical protein
MEIDLMTYRLEGKRLTVLKLQEGEKATYTARTWACKGEAPKGFDLCLELTGGDRPLRYFSRSDWSVGAPLPAEARIAERLSISLDAVGELPELD